MTLYPLIRLLSDGCFHSGTWLGAQLGISRTAVWKQIQQLERLGLNCQVDRHLGYALQQPLELLDQQYLARCWLQNEIFADWHLELLPVLDSTNTELMRRYHKGAVPANTVLLTELQTEGKGRRGRQWKSAFACNLCFSLAWSFDAPAQQLSGLSLMLGVAAARALSAAQVQGVGLKWPNDIYLNDAKLGGILVEIAGDLSGPCQLIIGVGINWQRPQGELLQADYPVAYCSDVAGVKLSRNDLLLSVIKESIAALNVFAQAGFKPYCADWNSLHIWKGREAFLLAGSGQSKVVLGDANCLGELAVQDEQGEWCYLSSGELSLRLKDDSGS